MTGGAGGGAVEMEAASLETFAAGIARATIAGTIGTADPSDELCAFAITPAE